MTRHTEEKPTSRLSDLAKGQNPMLNPISIQPAKSTKADFSGIKGIKGIKQENSPFELWKLGCFFLCTLHSALIFPIPVKNSHFGCTVNRSWTLDGVLYFQHFLAKKKRAPLARFKKGGVATPYNA